MGTPAGYRAPAQHSDRHYDAVFQVGTALTCDQAVDHTRRVLDLINETSDPTSLSQAPHIPNALRTFAKP
jgi:hypothetical protein